MLKIKAVNILLITTLLVATIGSTATITFVWAATPSFTTIIETGSMTETATYTIFTDGSNFFAKNGSTGELTRNSADCDSLVNVVIDDCVEGDSVFVTAGAYTIDDEIIIDEEITFQGAGWGKTVFTMATGGSAEDMIILNATYVILKDLTLQANATARHCLTFQNASDGSWVRGLECINATSDGIYIEKDVTGGKISGFRISGVDRYGIHLNGTDFEILDGLIRSPVEGDTEAGIFVTAGGGTKFSMIHIWGTNYGVQIGDTGDPANRVYFSDCGFNDIYRDGVYFYGGGGYDVSFINCEFKEIGDQAAGTYDSISVHTDAAFQRIRIEGCQFVGERGGTNYTRYVLNCAGSGESRVVFTGNMIHDGTFTGSPDLIQSLSTAMAYQNVVSDNTGYITEWTEDDIFPSGNSSYAFEHPLVSTPTYVDITWREAPHASSVGLLHFVTRNATHFKIYLIDANDGTGQAADEDLIFMWHARYTPP